jgi:hypothetical protein
MNDPSEPKPPPDNEEDAWDFDGARRHHIRQGLRMTPAERLRWLEETVDEMRRLQGLARLGRTTDESQG